jgi:F-type H+-transporting ATPase subunit a
METFQFLEHFRFGIGPLMIETPVLTTWVIMLLLAISSYLLTRNLSRSPGRLQVVLEGAYLTTEKAISDLLPKHASMVFPFIASLWLFIGTANLFGLLPGFSSPTSELSVTGGLALLVFLSVHWYGIRAIGSKNYFKHYLTPSPLLLPFEIISEISRTLALAIRLFGNVMSLEMAAALILLVAGFLAPVPILMLHVVEAIIQAYLFGMLALIYITGGIQSQVVKHTSSE